ALHGLAAPLPPGVSGGPCLDEARDELELPDAAPPGVSGYLGFARFECAVVTLLARPDTRAGRALARFLEAARRSGGVGLGADVLPISRGEGAVFLSRGRERPTATLVVDGVSRQRALDLMGRLQPALLRLTQPLELGAAPAFSARAVDGVQVVTATLGPQLELSYAAFDGRLVVSTSAEGVLATRRGGGLEGREDVEAVLGDRPQRPSSLVFLALDQLLALGDRVGLAADPGFRAVRDALRGLPAAGASVSREGDDTTAELTFLTP
nr:hypothetical protein [Actinomycetota bacterium]